MNAKSWGRTLTVAGLLAAVALVGACSSGDDKGDGKTNAPAAKSSGEGKAQTVKVTLKDNVFEPKDITVEEGAVTFEVTNAGAAIHNMHVMSASVEGRDFVSTPIIEGGKTDKFTATLTKKGTVKFQCDFHLPDMVGTITVK